MKRPRTKIAFACLVLGPAVSWLVTVAIVEFVLPNLERSIYGATLSALVSAPYPTASPRSLKPRSGT